MEIGVRLLYRSACLVLALILAAGLPCAPEVQAGDVVLPQLPAPGTMIDVSPAFTPARLQGLSIRPHDALSFDFLINQGDSRLAPADKKAEYGTLIKYFLAALTVPEKDQWVNLSPYERDRIIVPEFGRTEMGHDLLAQDYLFKQIASSLMFPEKGLGRKFWDEVYAKVRQENRTLNIPVNTFNKVWIVPDEAVVYESGHTVVIIKSHLKVMLEDDYLAAKKGSVRSSKAPGTSQHQALAPLIRRIILPVLEQEINHGRNFARLRQMFSAMILATWYKRALKNSLLGQVYQDKAKVKGVDQAACREAEGGCAPNEEIYQSYLSAFKRGVYNFVKEEVDPQTRQTIPRKYFAGGWEPLQSAIEADAAMMGTPHVLVMRPRTAGEFLRTYKRGMGILEDKGSIDRATVSLHAFSDEMISPEDVHLGPYEALHTREVVRVRVAAAVFQELAAMLDRGEEEEVAQLAMAAGGSNTIDVGSYTAAVPRVKLGEIIPGLRLQGKPVYDQPFFNEQGTLNNNVAAVVRASVAIKKGKVILSSPFRRDLYIGKDEFRGMVGISNKLRTRILSRVGRVFFLDLKPRTDPRADTVAAAEELPQQSFVVRPGQGDIQPQVEKGASPPVVLEELIRRGLLPHAALRYVPLKGRSGLSTERDDVIMRVIALVSRMYGLNAEQQKTLDLFLRGEIFFEDALPIIFPPPATDLALPPAEAALTVAWYMARYDLRDENFSVLVHYLARYPAADMPATLRSALLMIEMVEQFNVQGDRPKKALVEFFLRPSAFRNSLVRMLSDAGLSEPLPANVAAAAITRQRRDEAEELVHAALLDHSLEGVFHDTKQLMDQHGIAWQGHRGELVRVLREIVQDYLTPSKGGGKADFFVTALPRVIAVSQQLWRQAESRQRPDAFAGALWSEAVSFLHNDVAPLLSDGAMVAAIQPLPDMGGVKRTDPGADADGTKGGIDFDGKSMSLRILRQGPRTLLPASTFQVGELKNIDGLSADIVHITPAGELRVLSELRRRLLDAAIPARHP